MLAHLSAAAPVIDDDESVEDETFETDCPLAAEVGCTSSSDEETVGAHDLPRPRIAKPWSDLLFPKSRIDFSPSVILGMSRELELQHRRFLAEIILKFTLRLSLSLDTFSVGVILLQRFLMYRSIQEIDRRMLTVACVFLASKTTDDRRPPIKSVIYIFYLAFHQHQLDDEKDVKLYQRLCDELLFWESQLLLVLGFNVQFNLSKERREIDDFCMKRVHIPRHILDSSICAFTLNAIGLTTLPVRCSYRLIYLVSISLTLAWAKQSEPRDLSAGKLWWQFLCKPNQPGVEGFEAIKEEILSSMESTKTRFLNI